MDFQNININRISIDEHLNITYKTSKNEIKPLIIRSPLLFIPFEYRYCWKKLFYKCTAKKIK